MMPGNADVHHRAELILGQFYFATGAGAGLQWIKEEACSVIREMYLPSIIRALEDPGGPPWNDDAPWILHFMETIGRLAATLAASVGRHAIGEADMRSAIEAVEAQVKSKQKDADLVNGRAPVLHPLGRWCDR